MVGGAHAACPVAPPESAPGSIAGRSPVPTLDCVRFSSPGIANVVKLLNLPLSVTSLIKGNQFGNQEGRWRTLPLDNLIPKLVLELAEAIFSAPSKIPVEPKLFKSYDEATMNAYFRIESSAANKPLCAIVNFIIAPPRQ